MAERFLAHPDIRLLMFCTVEVAGLILAQRGLSAELLFSGLADKLD